MPYGHRKYAYNHVVVIISMSNMYVKDEKGKYRLVDKDRDQKGELQNTVPHPLSLDEIDAGLKRLEGIVLDPRR